MLVTGYGSSEHCVEAMKSGVHDYLTKPFAPAALLRAVATASTDTLVTTGLTAMPVNGPGSEI